MKAQDNSKGWPEGWLVAAAAAVLSAVMARVVGEVGLFAAVMIAIFVFLVFGVLLGMFWGGPLADPHGSHDARDHGHGHAPARHGDAAMHPATPVAAGIAEHGALEMMALDDIIPAPTPEPLPAVAPEAVATDDGMAQPPVAQPLIAELAPAPMQPEPTTPIAEGGIKPQGLAGARGGVPDRLQAIEGIGPVLEKLCHEFGIYHFDQIAGWGAAEIAWMDGNLKGFKGRVSRDKWVRQAALIGDVGVDEFLRRAKTNDY